MGLRRLENPPRVQGISVYQTSWILRGSAICLPGIGIFLSESIPDSSQKSIIQHEYGHFLDYQNGVEGDRKKFLGSYLLGFYLKIGIPSIFNLTPILQRIPIFEGEHRTFWTEIRANKLASIHFGDLLAEGFETRFPTQA